MPVNDNIKMIDPENAFLLSENKNDNDNFPFRSEDIQEVVTRRPGFFERWALLLFLFILSAMVAGTWFINYPDVVRANATLTVANGPKELVVRQDGKLVNLFVSNDGFVRSGETVAWIESTARHNEVIELSESLEQGVIRLNSNEIQKVSGLFNHRYSNLGELQLSYQQFMISLQQFNDYLINGYYRKRTGVLYKDKAYLENVHHTIEKQEKLTQQDIALTQETIDASNSLFNDKVISKQDMRDLKSKFVNKQIGIPQLESSLLSNENAQADKQKEIAELEHTISQQTNLFQQSLLAFRSLVDQWKNKYIITAPVEGNISFIVPLQQNQFMQGGKTIGYVNPRDSRYFAQVNLTQNSLGKIDTGLGVQLRFDAYPFQEFGFIYGRLNYISRVPTDSGFLATVELPNGLQTNYKRSIQYRNGLKSQALIVTKNQRLLERFFNSLVKNASIQ